MSSSQLVRWGSIGAVLAGAAYALQGIVILFAPLVGDKASYWIGRADARS